MLHWKLNKYRLFLACDLDLTGFGLGPVMGFTIGVFHYLILSEKRWLLLSYSRLLISLPFLKVTKGYRLGGRGIGVQFLAGAGGMSNLYSVWTGCVVRQSSIEWLQRISAGTSTTLTGLLWFSLVTTGKYRHSTSSRPQHLPSKPFLIHHSSIIL
jgi:hypothetical protein